MQKVKVACLGSLFVPRLQSFQSRLLPQIRQCSILSPQKINASKQSQSPNTLLHYNHANNITMETSLENCILINKVATSYVPNLGF
jgi:hypothetical protein